MSEHEISHEEAEGQLKQVMDWPQYYVSGENVDEENFVPAYYRVEGPNGPVSYINPDGDPQPTTMHDFAMEARSDSFRWCEREETPWTRVEECD